MMGVSSSSCFSRLLVAVPHPLYLATSSPSRDTCDLWAMTLAQHALAALPKQLQVSACFVRPVSLYLFMSRPVYD